MLVSGCLCSTSPHARALILKLKDQTIYKFCSLSYLLSVLSLIAYMEFVILINQFCFYSHARAHAWGEVAHIRPARKRSDP